ncbi:Pyrroline-5-carboxylate reductase [Polystyrenella longa]|uniref:Pyrroline-5-carboxylate reductase n=1 Tax=Polystyrenella longa TaxID=2528007 RepID=A0A518CI50_9PLAN|nr:pyrroline-5-carboxylate reductase [Polystyrenella longa]QDU78909.1 Pyrroline-5-carboxylate reductase [Polystyrenella longa]
MSDLKPVNERVGFIGAGQMAIALAKGFLQSGLIQAKQLHASDPNDGNRGKFAEATGGVVQADNRTLIQNVDIIILAVKPQYMPDVLTELKSEINTGQLVISIAAGVSIHAFEKSLGTDQRIIRVMPNTPCQIGAGASGFARGGAATPEDAELTRRMLETVGIAFEVPEIQLDAITGLSGSGPAYVYQIIEALSDGGVLVGLPRNTATKLAAQTLYGAARMVLETGQHPGQLKDAVTSPAGTTITGLAELEEGQLRATLINAVRAATERSRELSN